jgi:hypothetical protein
VEQAKVQSNGGESGGKMPGQNFGTRFDDSQGKKTQKISRGLIHTVLPGFQASIEHLWRVQLVFFGKKFSIDSETRTI